MCSCGDPAGEAGSRAPLEPPAPTAPAQGGPAGAAGPGLAEAAARAGVSIYYIGTFTILCIAFN